MKSFVSLEYIYLHDLWLIVLAEMFFQQPAVNLSAIVDLHYSLETHSSDTK